MTVGGGTPVSSGTEALGAVVGYKFTDASSGTIFIRTTTPSGVTTAHAVNVNMADLDDADRCVNH